MIRCVVLASVALHIAIFAVLPDARPPVTRAPETPSLVEVASEPPKKEPEPMPEQEPEPVTPRPATVNRAPTAVSANVHAAANPIDTTASPMSGLAVDGDGPADFTASVISNAAAGVPAKIVVNAPAAPKPSSPSGPPGPTIVPVASLSRRPGAPGLDAELEKNYPVDARRSGISGTAKLRVQILADGRVGRVEHVSESHLGFGTACARTVRAARWEPPLDREGRAVATEIVYVCRFEVRS